jgi:hypothetical protein
MLSSDEDRELRAIEQWFEESDPQLTRMLRAHENPARDRQQRALRLGVDVTGGVLLLMGALAASAILVVFGVLALSAGVCLHLAVRAHA